MSLTAKALWTIERHLGNDLSLGFVAEMCGVTRHHLAHAFGEATGQSLMAHVRARRLSEAAQALAAGSPDILALALDSGYGSHEAFSRAFRAQFATTPEAVRRARSTAGLALVKPMPLPKNDDIPVAAPEIRQASAILAVGLRGTHSFAESDGIPSQWGRFIPFLAEIADKVQPIPIGVMGEANEEGRFDYLCGAEVRRATEVPQGCVTLEIAPATYAVFRHRDHISAIRRTYAAIFDRALADHGLTPADAPIVQRHEPGFDAQTGLGGVTMWVPVTA